MVTRAPSAVLVGAWAAFLEVSSDTHVVRSLCKVFRSLLYISRQVLDSGSELQLG
jgi:hypothetical protein